MIHFPSSYPLLQPPPHRNPMARNTGPWRNPGRQPCCNRHIEPGHNQRTSGRDRIGPRWDCSYLWNLSLRLVGRNLDGEDLRACLIILHAECLDGQRSESDVSVCRNAQGCLVEPSIVVKTDYWFHGLGREVIQSVHSQQAVRA